MPRRACDTAGMLRILPQRLHAPLSPLPLHGLASSQRLEADAARALPPHTLMARAAQAIVRLGRAWQPHARRIWVACGPGNNGGDGVWAALLWQQHLQATGGGQVWVTRLGDPARAPADAQAAWRLALDAGIALCEAPPNHVDLQVDALFGLGLNTPLSGTAAALQEALLQRPVPTLCVDLPSGLDGGSGHWLGPGEGAPTGPRLTLSLLTLKPGLFTGQGRAVAGDVWWDDLGLNLGADTDLASAPPDAWLHFPAPRPPRQLGHGHHKGSHGSVVVLGGQTLSATGHAMTGAALLAARAALMAGAGRVTVGLLGEGGPMLDPVAPELMFRSPALLLAPQVLGDAVVVAGCGAGTAASEWLSTVLEHAPRLVLDADALNTIAQETALQSPLQARADRGWLTVLTPHPLEAARLLGSTVDAVQHDRLAAAQALAQRLACGVVLKGSGTVVAGPHGAAPRVNPTGNDLLGSAGTGDVLAGWLGAALCTWRVQAPGQPMTQSDWTKALSRVADAVWAHGAVADQWPAGHAFSASGLAARAHP